jgi:hypothetical protein
LETKKLQKRLGQLRKETRYHKMKNAKCHKDKYGCFPASSRFVGEAYYETNGEWKILSVDLKEVK